MDPHDIVGVAKDATEAEIRTAYKKLAMKWHPDRPCNADRRAEATAKFAEINRAHRILMRQIRKAQREEAEKKPEDPAPRPKERQRRPSRPSSPSSPPSEKPSAPPAPTPPETPKQESASDSPPSSPTSTRRSSVTDPSDASDSPFTSARSSRTSFSEHGPFIFQSSTLPEFPEWESISCSPSAYPSTTSLPRSSSPATSSSPASPTGTTDRSRLRKSPSNKDELDSSTATAQDCHPGSSPRSEPITSDRQSSSYHPDRVDGTLRPDRPILRGRASDVSKSWTHVLSMTLEQLYHGKTFHFNVVRYRLSGKKSVYPLELEVPPGCRDGTQIIIPNVGNERKDGSRQDIVFLIKESASGESKFRRVHDNLVMDVRLGWVESLEREAGVVHFTGIDGQELSFNVNYHVSRVLSGSVVIPDAGMLLRNGNGKRGRLLVRWSISSPKSPWGRIPEECYAGEIQDRQEPLTTLYPHDLTTRFASPPKVLPGPFPGHRKLPLGAAPQYEGEPSLAFPLYPP